MPAGNISLGSPPGSPQQGVFGATQLPQQQQQQLGQQQGGQNYQGGPVQPGASGRFGMAPPQHLQPGGGLSPPPQNFPPGMGGAPWNRVIDADGGNDQDGMMG